MSVRRRDAPAPTGSSTTGWPSWFAFFARQQHAGDGAAVQGANVDVQPAADGGDILHLGGIVGHNGRSTAGQHHVGAVVHGDVVGNIMNEGAFGADIGKLLCKHDAPPSGKAAPAWSAGHRSAAGCTPARPQ